MAVLRQAILRRPITAAWIIACAAIVIGMVDHFGWSLRLAGRATRGYGGDFAAAALAREEPLLVPPASPGLLSFTRSDYARLLAATPRHEDGALNSSSCLHLLRADGPGARLDGRDAGIGVLDLLLSEEEGRRRFGQSSWVKTRYGIRFPTAAAPSDVLRDPSLEHHRDQTLAAMAEMGVPLSRTVGADGATLRDALRDSLANFHLKQDELAWTALAYGLYLPPVREWANRYGEVFTFDSMVGEMLSRPPLRDSCGGVHTLYALNVILRTDQLHTVLSLDLRDRVRHHLARNVAEAVRMQGPDGSWAVNWNYRLGLDVVPRLPTPPDTAPGRLLATGHLAEWFLYLPADLRPPEEALKRAGMWLWGALSRASKEEMGRMFCPYTHASCALRRIVSIPDGE